jgi:hypothetical protein
MTISERDSTISSLVDSGRSLELGERGILRAVACNSGELSCEPLPLLVFWREFWRQQLQQQK